MATSTISADPEASLPEATMISALPTSSAQMGEYAHFLPPVIQTMPPCLTSGPVTGNSSPFDQYPSPEMEVCSRDELVTGGSSVVKHKSSLLVQQELHCYQSEVTTASKKIDELDGVIRRKKTTKKRPQSRRIDSLDSELSQYRLSVNFHRERVSVYNEKLGEAMAEVCQRMDQTVDKMSSLEAGQVETGSKMDALAKNFESSFKEASELVSSLKEQNELLASSLQESTEYLTSTNQLLHEANRKVEEANRRVSDFESKFERLMEEVRKSRSDARRDLDGPKLEAFEKEVREELNSKNKRRLNCCVCS